MDGSDYSSDGPVLAHELDAGHSLLQTSENSIGSARIDLTVQRNSPRSKTIISK